MSSDDLFAGLFAGLFADLPTEENPTVPTSQAVGGIEQSVDNVGVSRHSHAENGGLAISDRTDPKSRDFCPPGSRVASYHVSEVGSAGNVGTGVKTLAVPDTSLFPPPSILVGKEEDKWELPALPAGCTPISPTAIRAAVERELRALAEDGREGAAALRDAVEIARAKVRNSDALAERQAHGGRCHVCDAPLDDSAPVIAVLTGRRGAHLFLHAGCCDAYTARRVQLVDRTMAAAGFDERDIEVKP